MSVAVQSRPRRSAESIAPPAYRPHAGHAVHFLQRLDRVDPGQVELALGLYNDPEVVRATLAMGKLPDGAVRVAISLDHPKTGPFIIVTREGRFVTCLGAGMRTDLPVITRAELDTTARQVGRLRELLAHIRSGAGARCDSLITRLLESGEHVSREQMEEMLRWEPLLGGLFLRSAIEYSETLRQLSPRVRSVVRPRARHEELLYAYHHLLHGLGHLFVLAGASEVSRRCFEDVLADGPLSVTPTICASALDVAYVSHRAMWAAARWPRLFRLYQYHLRKAPSELQLSDGCFGTAAIGLATHALRNDARKSIAKLRVTDPSFTERAEMHRQLLSMPFTHPELMAEWGLSRGRAELCERIPGMRPEDIADADARAQLASAPGHMAWTPDDLTRNAIALPALVRAEPQELYLPQRIIDAIREPWRMERTIAALASNRAAFGVLSPIRVVRVGGRNDPCPCGSGRKLKRCCLHARAAS